MKYVYAMVILESGVMFFSSKEKALKFANNELSDAPGSTIKSFKALEAYDGWGKRIKLDGGDIGISVNVEVG